MNQSIATAQTTKEGNPLMFHIALTIRLARILLNREKRDGKKQSCFINVKTNKYVSFKKAFAQLDCYEKMGYEVVPPCDHIKPDGCCAGHQETE